MPYPKHNRLVVRGRFGTTPEIWSYSLRFNSDVTAGVDVKPNDWNQAGVTAAINAFHASALFNSQTDVWGWRGYQIGPDGRLIGNNFVINEYTAKTSGSSANLFPPQVALVMTLIANDRGPARMGRCFLPGPATAVQSTDLRIAASGALSYANAFKTMVESLKNAMYTDPLIIGESLVNVSPVGPGTLQKVTKYRCGRVYDTIRTRRNKMLEDYQEVAA